MLEGTDLYAAYQPLGGGGGSPYEAEPSQQAQNHRERREQDEPSPKKSTLIQTLPSSASIPLAVDGPVYEPNLFNKQYEQEQRILNALAELKRQKQDVSISSQPSYVDKILNKKKEIIKLLQFALVIVLGLSIHHIIKVYLKSFISENDFSWERILLLRLLYPIAIIFILWNLKTFVK